MPKEIGPKEKQLRAMREARLAAASASTPSEKPKPVKRKPKA